LNPVRSAVPALNYHWSLAPAQPLLAERLAAALGVSPLLAQCLVNRGLSDPEPAAAFLAPRLRQLSDPLLLPQMDRAVQRLWLARERRERVVIFGDYDVDGVTATALLLEVLRRLGWEVAHYLPHRLDEGYGLSPEAAQRCVALGPTPLLLAVDCGSTAGGTIDQLGRRGTDVIVLDHHQIADPPPAAVALVNPQRLAETASPVRDLCSVGLAFKLAHALVKEGRQRGLGAARACDLRSWLDLVALGTIADVVPLTGENRILVRCGLPCLDEAARPGVRALQCVAQSPRPVGVYEVGYQLAPRLNAAGRLETATTALDLLLAREPAAAESLAQLLDRQNRERQRVERAIADDVIRAVRARFNPETDYVILEGQMLWHIGVVGIVAARVLREFYRPTLILGGDGAVWRGSGRSIEGFDLAAALRECDDLLLRHGGHALAAGLAVSPANVDALRNRLNALARRTLAPHRLRPSLRLDAEVQLADLHLDRVAELGRLEPTGQGNPPVQFCARQLRLCQPVQRIGREQRHARLRVTDGQVVQEVVWWNCGDAAPPEGRFDLAFAPQIHAFNATRSVQLKLLAWRPAGP
jgi:single-stranded-DNA-specific exonuclease